MQRWDLDDYLADPWSVRRRAIIGAIRSVPYDLVPAEILAIANRHTQSLRRPATVAERAQILHDLALVNSWLHSLQRRLPAIAEARTRRRRRR